MDFEVFKYEETLYLIDKNTPDRLYHYCIGIQSKMDQEYGQIPCVNGHTCDYFHAAYVLSKDFHCVWCNISIPILLSSSFVREPLFFDIFCPECYEIKVK